MSKEDHPLVRIANVRHKLMCKTIASVAVCAIGSLAMWITKGETGIGWAIFGLMIIWGVIK